MLLLITEDSPPKQGLLVVKDATNYPGAAILSKSPLINPNDVDCTPISEPAISLGEEGDYVREPLADIMNGVNRLL